MKKTNGIWINFLAIQVLLSILYSGCSSKDELAVLTTVSASNIEVTTALSGGTITSDGGSPIGSRGVCWNTTSTPTVADNKTTDGRKQNRRVEIEVTVDQSKVPPETK